MSTGWEKRMQQARPCAWVGLGSGGTFLRGTTTPFRMNGLHPTLSKFPRMTLSDLA